MSHHTAAPLPTGRVLRHGGKHLLVRYLAPEGYTYAVVELQGWNPPRFLALPTADLAEAEALFTKVTV